MGKIPLFVVGVQRSGTTWLANTLCNHPRVYGVQSEKYGGIVESWFFSHLNGRFHPLNQEQNYRLFLDHFCRTPFFRESGVGRAQLQRRRPASAAAFFLSFMQLAARQKPHCRYVLEKTPVHTLYLPELATTFTEAKFVSVTRSVEGVVASALRLEATAAGAGEERAAVWQLAWLVFHWRRYQAFLDHFRRRYPHRVCHLVYEALVDDAEAEFRRCLACLGLAWDAALLQERYGRNTSFAGKTAAGKNRLRPRQKSIIQLVYLVARLVPYRAFYCREKRRRPRTREPIPFLVEQA